MAKVWRTAGILLVAATSFAAAPPATAAPDTRLEDADLVCAGDRLSTGEWVWVAKGTTWITAGPLAGHYVILAESHYLAPGLLADPPASFDGLAVLEEKTLGTKEGLAPGAMTCRFVSRWAGQGFSVVGEVTLAPVP